MRLRLERIGVTLILLMVLKSGVADGIASSKESAGCFGEIHSALVAGGYSGSLDCRSISVHLKKVGAVGKGTDFYTIYDLRYKTIPAAGLVAHGGQKILVFKNNNTYVGQYPLSPPPQHNMHIRGTSIYVGVAKKFGNQISFEKGVPPGEVYIDGEFISLSK